MWVFVNILKLRIQYIFISFLCFDKKTIPNKEKYPREINVANQEMKIKVLLFHRQ